MDSHMYEGSKHGKEGKEEAVLLAQSCSSKTRGSPRVVTVRERRAKGGRGKGTFCQHRLQLRADKGCCQNLQGACLEPTRWSGQSVSCQPGLDPGRAGLWVRGSQSRRVGLCKEAKRCQHLSQGSILQKMIPKLKGKTRKDPQVTEASVWATL